MVADLLSTTTPPRSKVLSRSPAPAKPKRAPLLPSGRENNAPPLPRRPNYTDVTSRYLPSTASANHNSDTTSSFSSSSSSSSFTTTTSSSNSVSTPRRPIPSPVVPVTPQSAVNRRHIGDLRTGEMSTAAKMLTKTSARSLSVSFQGESFALPVSKIGKPANNGLRNGKPERKKSPATPVDNRRLEERSRQRNFTTMSVDFTNEKMKLTGSRTASAVRALRKSMITETLLENKNIDSEYSDRDTQNIITSGNVNRGGGGPRAIVVPARFWQETINLLKRVQPDPVSSPLMKNNNKQISGCKDLDDRSKLSPSISQSAMRNAVGSINNLGNKPSILSFPADSKRGKVGEKKLLDAHMLRLLHNKHMQWRFANAKVDAAMVVQRATAQKSLYNALVTISKLWNSVISKRAEMQQLKQNLKLYSILKRQMVYLDNWDKKDKDHSMSLAGTIVALQSSCLCLPVLSGAKADVQNLKDAIWSAVDVMQTMAVSICSLVNKVEHVNTLASELAIAMKTECSLLYECKDMFSTLTLLEMHDCSLRSHSLQLINPAPPKGEW